MARQCHVPPHGIPFPPIPGHAAQVRIRAPIRGNGTRVPVPSNVPAPAILTRPPAEPLNRLIRKCIRNRRSLPTRSADGRGSRATVDSRGPERGQTGPDRRASGIAHRRGKRVIRSGQAKTPHAGRQRRLRKRRRPAYAADMLLIWPRSPRARSRVQNCSRWRSAFIDCRSSSTLCGPASSSSIWRWNMTFMRP